MQWVSTKGQWLQVGAAFIGLVSFLGWVVSFAYNWLKPTPPLSALHVDCKHTSPYINLPPDGRVYLAGLIDLPKNQVGGGLAQLTAPTDKPYKPTGGESPYYYKCVVSNYGTQPILNVRFDLNVAFRKTQRDQENRSQPAEISMERAWPVFIEKVDVGALTPFTFYIANMTKLYVGVDIAQKATFTALGEHGQFTVPLISQGAPIFFFPSYDSEPQPPKP